MLKKNIRRSLPMAEVVEGRMMLAAHPAIRVGTPSVTPASSSDGLTGTYYFGRNFRVQDFVRTDSSIDFNWGQGAPDPSLLGRAFSVRWTGQVVPQYSETYTFHTIADDGIRVWVGGKLVINDWQDQYATEATGKISLQAGQAYDIRVDYFENGAPPAAVKLSWSSPSQVKQVVSANSLRTGSAQGTPAVGSAPSTVSTAPAAPLNLSASAPNSSEIDLRWTGVAGAGGYVVQRSSDGINNWGTVQINSAQQTTLADTGVSAGTTYYYRVLTTGTAGTSAPSNVASATTLTAAPAVPPAPVQPLPPPAPLPPPPAPVPPPAPPAPVPPPPPQNIVYGLTNDGKVERIDTTTAATTQVGTLLFGTAAGDRDPADGKFYYLEQNTRTPRLAVWDPATNTNTVLGGLSLSDPVLRATFNAQGVLYITAGNGDLYTVNTTTATATFVGAITANGSQLPSSSGDMVFGAEGAALYLEANGSLYRVSLASLQATYLGSDGNIGNLQIAHGSDGTLYGTDGSGDLYTINLTNGSATLIGNTGVLQIGDLAHAVA